MEQTLKLSNTGPPKSFWEIPVLYEDANLLAIDKPADLLSSPSRENPHQPHLMKLMHFSIEHGTAWAKERKLTYLANAHRLDFDTTGAFLLAKDKPTLISLA